MRIKMNKLKKYIYILLLILTFCTLMSKSTIASNTTKDSKTDTTSQYIYLEKYLSTFEEDEIVFSDIYDNGKKYAIVLRKLPTYEESGRTLYRQNYFVLHIACYNKEFRTWEDMTAYPLILLDKSVQAEISVERISQGHFQFIQHDQPIYTLSFSKEQFVLSKHDIFETGYKPIPAIESALLLGVEGKSLCSYFIYEEEGLLNIMTKPDSIIVPTPHDFYQVTSFQHHRIMHNTKYGTKDYEREFLENKEYYDYCSYKNKEDVMALADKRVKTYETYFDEYGFDTSRDHISFISNGFISYYNSYFWHGGGTGKATIPTIFFNEIEHMNEDRFLEDENEIYMPSVNKLLLDYLPDRKKEIERKVEHVRKEYDEIDISKKEESEYYLQRYFIEIENLILVHEEGELKCKLAVEEYSYAPNGSPHGSYGEYIDLGVTVPQELIGGNTLCVEFDTIRGCIPDAIDAYSSPDGKLLAVETLDRLIIYVRESTKLDFDYSDSVYSIYKSEGDRVIMAEWALGGWVQKWKTEIMDMKTQPIHYFKSIKGTQRG